MIWRKGKTMSKWKIEVEISNEDFNIITKYGYHIERNAEEMIKEVAAELRRLEKEAMSKN